MDCEVGDSFDCKRSLLQLSFLGSHSKQPSTYSLTGLAVCANGSMDIYIYIYI